MIQQNKFGEPVYTQQDLIDAVMSGHNIFACHGPIVVQDIDPTTTAALLDQLALPTVEFLVNNESMDIEQFDAKRQRQWFMPKEYQDFDVAAYLLNLCKDQAQLQRVGEELLLYQERGLFDLLRYLKYLVDTMKTHNVVWGVGRGSSVASYVLYLLEVHRIDSLFYELDPREFLR
jgi:DNA polymerase III alpha subunit